MATTIEAYLDDSADAQMQRYCASGGFFATPEQWDAFTLAWSHLTHGLRETFHTTDCEGGRDKDGREFGYAQFSSWPKDKRIALITNLVDVIQGTQLAGFGSIVPIEAYKKAFPGCADTEPYKLAIPHVLMNMASIADNWGVDVNIWFEDGGPVGFIAETFQNIKRMNWLPSKRLKSLWFSGKEIHALQAADLLAREAFKHLDNLGRRPIRKPFARIGENVFFITWTEGSLRYLAANGGTKNLELLAHWDKTRGAPLLRHDSLWRPKKQEGEKESG
ncbi:MAG: hypothetical protein ACRD4X_17205 [Candidatus Acidiferrales bacterium]